MVVNLDPGFDYNLTAGKLIQKSTALQLLSQLD